MAFPLSYLASWSPFRLDALGLVTLIGAEEVSNAVGALQHNRFTEYLPLFGQFLVAEDRLTTPLPGYTLYNISDGVYIPVISGWFSRWLFANLDDRLNGGTHMTWSVTCKTRRSAAIEIVAIAIGILGNGGLLAVSALQGDYYGVANAAAMIVSVLVRRVILNGKRKSLNGRVRASESRRLANNGNLDNELVGILITTPDGNAALCRVHRAWMRFLIPDLAEASYVARAIGWIAFATHVVCIGQAYLLSQLCSVGLLVIATALTIFHFGNDREEVGGNIRIILGEPKRARRDALLELVASSKEQQVLQDFWQLPHKPEHTEQQAYSSDFYAYWNKMMANRQPGEVAAIQPREEQV